MGFRDKSGPEILKLKAQSAGSAPLPKAPGPEHFWEFRKLGVPYFGVLIIRILLFRVLY